MATETPGMVCGPTTGCGQTTPMVPTRIHTVNGIEKGWQAPAACSRCGKPFGFFSLINNPPPIAPLSPWFVFASSLGEPVSQEAQLAEMEARKDAAYLERNQVVAALAKVVLLNGGKAGIRRTAIEGWSDEWHGCVYIDTPWGQASWHYHDSQSSLFASLPAYRGEWDGHTTEEKYARLASPSGSPASSPEAPIAAIRKAMLLLEAKLGDSDVTHHVDEYEEPLVAAFQVLLAASRSAFSGSPRTENARTANAADALRKACGLDESWGEDPAALMIAACGLVRAEQPEIEREGVRCVVCKRWHSGIGNDDRETDRCEDCASVISSASPLSEEALRVAFLAGVEDAVGPERCGAEYDAPSREYARRAFARLSASAPSPEDTRQAPGFLTDADIASLPEWK